MECMLCNKSIGLTRRRISNGYICGSCSRQYPDFNDLDNLIETLRNLGVDIEDPEKGINERSLKDEIINFVHHGEGDFNKIIGKIMEQDVAKGWE